MIETRVVHLPKKQGVASGRAPTNQPLVLVPVQLTPPEIDELLPEATFMAPPETVDSVPEAVFSWPPEGDLDG